MSQYREILRISGLTPLIVSQLVARAPGGMLTITLIMHAEHIFGSYALAGLVIAATSVGAAIAGPVTSRWMSTWGMRQVLLLTIAIYSATLLLMALVVTPFPVYALGGLLLGAANPPIQSAVRTIYPKLATARQLPAVFSLDASLQEIIWVLGPMLAAMIATQFGPPAAMLVAGLLALIGTIWFVAQPSVGSVRIPRSPRRLGSVLAKPPVMYMIIVGFTMIGICGAVEAATVAALDSEGIAAGLVLGAYSLGSFSGGLMFGSARVTSWSLVRRLTIVFLGTAAASVFMNAWWIGLMLLLSGLGIAPALGLLYTYISSSVRFSDTAEAYGWLGTGQLIGSALGAAAAGFAVDAAGAQAAFGVATAIAAVTVVLAVIARRRLPDLSDGAIGPLPDTAPTPVVG